MLGILAVLVFLIFLVVHFAFPEEKPFFKCALVNQKIDSDRDVVLSEEFATFSGLDAKRIVFDSDYVISYKEAEKNRMQEMKADLINFSSSGLREN